MKNYSRLHIIKLNLYFSELVKIPIVIHIKIVFIVVSVLLDYRLMAYGQFFFNLPNGNKMALSAVVSGHASQGNIDHLKPTTHSLTELFMYF